MSNVHASPSSQIVTLPPVHTPLAQTSPAVQALLSSHAVPSFALLKLQPPVLASQLSVVQALPSSHAATLPLPTHAPPWHLSPTVQTLPSSHAMPFATFAVHAPLTHRSVVHTLPSLHSLSVWQALPQLAIALWLHVPVFLSQRSSVQALLSSHIPLPLPSQMPVAQTSPLVQTLPSSQKTPLRPGACWHFPVAPLHASLVHTLPSSQLSWLPLHTPPWQVSPPVHASLSLQPLPLSAVSTHRPLTHAVWMHCGLMAQSFSVVHALPHLGICTYTHLPVAFWQTSTVQSLPSPQTVGVPAQVPLWQVSPVVHALSSLHALPLVAGLVTHLPAILSQLSMVQALPSSQTTFLPVLHAPPLQTSPKVHALPSLQVVPSAGVLVQWPELHKSAVQTLASSQSLSILHALPHRGMAECWQTPPAQLSAVQASPSSQLMLPVPTHTPVLHTSPLVHALPSLHGTLLGPGPTRQLPVLGSQPSLVQTLPSSQTCAVPLQTPLAQVSPLVQPLASLQVVPVSGLCTHVPFTQLSAVHPFLSLHCRSLLHAALQLGIALWLHCPPLHASRVQASLSSQFKSLPTHTPPAHASLPVHGLPSLHAVPSLSALWLHVPPLQVSVVHGSPSVQFSLPPPTHLPPLHWSLSVQPSPSSQLLPLGAGALAHWPVPGAQVSTVQGFLSSHTTCLLLQMPPWQVSPLVHASPSLQLVPSLTGVCEHLPLLQAPTTQLFALVQSLSWLQPPPHPLMTLWLHVPLKTAQLSAVHAFLSSQSFWLPLQLPPVQVSPLVQALPSSQGPLRLVGTHAPLLGSQVPPVHRPVVAHTLATPAHLPSWHTSLSVHKSPSSQPLPLLLTWLHAPLLGSQLSSVHGLPSLQSLA